MAKNIDWDAVEREYRAGLKTFREMAAMFGISHKAIQNHADKHGWVRDLTAKIHAKTDEKVAKLEVKVAKIKKSRQIVAKSIESDIIDAVSDTQVAIIFSHRKDIKRSRELGFKLFEILESQTLDNESYAQLGKLMENPDGNYDKLNSIYQKIIAFPSLIDSYKKLTETMKTMIALERQAFNMADNIDDTPDKTVVRVHRIELVAPTNIKNVYAIEEEKSGNVYDSA